MPREGLIAIEKTVERGGSSHTQTFWVRPEDAKRMVARGQAREVKTLARLRQAKEPARIERASYGGKEQAVLKAGGREVGEVAIAPRPDGHYEVSNVLVWPESQRQGYGTQLYEQAERMAQEKGKKLFVSSDLTDDARAIHASLRERGALKPTGEISFAPTSEPAPEVRSAAEGVVKLSIAEAAGHTISSKATELVALSREDFRKAVEGGVVLPMYRGVSANSQDLGPQWYAADPATAVNYARNASRPDAEGVVRSRTVTMRKPYVASTGAEIINATGGTVERLKAEGYDGMIGQWKTLPGFIKSHPQGMRDIWAVVF